MSDENFIDVDYENYTNDEVTNEINGEALFYSATQVATLINEDVSTVRYWTKRFDRLLNIEISNKNRRQYKKIDIEKLRFIKKLAREDGLTLQQIEEYATAKGFNIESIEKSVIDSSNPLAIQTFISAMTIEIDKKLNSFAEDLINRINEQQKMSFIMQQEAHEKLQETIAVTVDEIVTEKIDSLDTKLDTSLQEIKSYFESQEQLAQQRDTELLDKLRKGMEEHRKQNEKELQKQNKSFFSRLFRK